MSGIISVQEYQAQVRGPLIKQTNVHSALFPGLLSYLRERCNKIMCFNAIGTSNKNIWINADIRIYTDAISLNGQWDA